MSSKLVWESVTWRCGEDQFRFDIERGGLFATLSAPGEQTLILPMVVWEGLIEALKANRAARIRNEQEFPARSRARWYDGETAELADGYRAGRTIAELARAHGRSAYAIEHQLDKLGLISTADIHGGQAHPGVHSSPTEAHNSSPVQAAARGSSMMANDVRRDG